MRSRCLHLMRQTLTTIENVYQNFKNIHIKEGVGNYLKHITIIDARMGRGKSSAAIQYMNRYKGQRCFLYITPYLTEVDRVCELCDFEEPNCDFTSKSNQLKSMMRRRCNIASTHALFTMMDNEALTLARENGYSLIIDESLQIIQGISMATRDRDMLLSNMMSLDKSGLVSWRDKDYDGIFNGYKQMADSGTLYYFAGSLYEVMNPKRFLSFDEVIMMTYMFDGQLQKAYFDYYGFDYTIVGIKHDEEGYVFSDHPDEPPSIDYSGLIHIVGENGYLNEKMNDIGENRTALSAGWFKKRGKAHDDIKALRCNLRNFFERKTGSRSNTRLWTTFKDCEGWMLGPRNRYISSFLPLNARATNAYRNADNVAYLANRFVDPNIAKFFAAKGIKINSDLFALSEMLQFIWRSAIRDGKEINLYIPSRRMRNLLIGWINDTSNGGKPL